MHPSIISTLLKKDEPVRMPNRTIELRPTHLFILPNGSTTDRPTFAIEMSAGNEAVVIGQVSFEMIFNSLSGDAKKLFESEWNRLKGKS